MAGPLLKDSVSETSTTTGTGSYTLAGARTGYSTFGSALANGDACHYVARDATGGGWEVGLGTWATGGTLARTRVIRSSNSNAAVNWSAGTREISLTQPVAAIAGPVTNVRGYGATGDGTTNDTAAVAAALADCPAGGTIYFPAGTYSLATWTVVNLTKQVRLQGAGPTASVLVGPDIVTNDFISTTKDVCVSDLGLSTFRRCVDMSPVATYLTDVQFDNLRLSNFNKGLYGKNTTPGAGVQNLRVTNCEFYDATDAFIYFDYPHMEDCLIADCYGRGSVTRFVHLDSNNVTYVRGRYIVRNNDFRTLFNPTNPGSAIGIIVYGTRATITGNILQDITNTEESDANGIYTKCRFFTISDNVLIDAAMAEGAINVKGTDRSLVESTSPYGYGGVVSNNVIWFTTGEATRNGIKIATNDVLCQGNYLEGCGDVGIYTDSKRLDNIMIRDNLVRKTKGAYGISLHGGGRNVKVVGNTVAGVSAENDLAAQGAGIRVSKNGGGDLEISDNIISDVADNGTSAAAIRVSSSVALSRVRIARNRITTTRRTFADGATTSGSPTLTSAALGLLDQLDVGMYVSGSGIPSGTKILSVESATSATMSANATATASGVSVTIGTLVPRGISFTTTTPDDVSLEFNTYDGATTPTHFGVAPTNFREVRSEGGGGNPLTFYDNTGAATSLYPTDGSAVTASLRTLGSGANQALPGNTVTGGAGGIGVYGDGTDGTTTLDGAASITWGSRSGSTYTMTRDGYLDSLTINSGVTLKTNSFRLYVRNTLTNGGTLHNNGIAGSGATGGASVTNQTCGSNGPGTTGGTGAGAAPAASQTNSLGSDGGAGGAGAGNAAGAGQNASAPSASSGRMHGLPQMALGKFLGASYAVANGGAGGGAGGGDGTNAGGGGGAGGAVLVLVAAVIVNNGVISANGGAGAAGVAGNAGGGGGGGGGAVLVTTSTPVTGSGTITASAGGGGAGSGTGSAGSSGTAGVTTTLTN